MEKKQEFDQQMTTFSESEGEAFTNILDESWDSDDGICASRSPAKTCKRIGKLLLFLICFFTFLILFSVGVMVLFRYVFDGKLFEEPEHIETTTQAEITTHREMIRFDSKFPQLIFEPRIDKNDSLIRCPYDTSGIRPYVKRMNTVIKSLNPMSFNFQHCNNNITRNMEKPCRFDKIQLGNTCTKSRKYGFNDCRVCVALMMSKVFDWEPIRYDNGSVPMEIQDRYQNNAVTVTCNGLGPVDVESMGPVSYYPSEGFHFKYFPYLGQEGYTNPMVMVHFKRPSKFMFINVECKAWAKNIDHSKNEGITRFELYLD